MPGERFSTARPFPARTHEQPLDHSRFPASRGSARATHKPVDLNLPLAER